MFRIVNFDAANSTSPTEIVTIIMNEFVYDLLQIENTKKRENCWADDFFQFKLVEVATAYPFSDQFLISFRKRAGPAFPNYQTDENCAYTQGL